MADVNWVWSHFLEASNEALLDLLLFGLVSEAEGGVAVVSVGRGQSSDQAPGEAQSRAQATPHQSVHG